jgi:hypothetical protein
VGGRRSRDDSDCCSTRRPIRMFARQTADRR